MLNRLKTLIANDTPPTEAPAPADRLHVAAAALLIRAAQIDGEVDSHEQQLLQRLVGPYFGLDDAEAAALLDQAGAAIDAANDLFQFTQQINASFAPEHKIMLVELLWRVVLADGVVDDYEANLIRRVAGLIHVTDTEAGAARKRAEAPSSH
jgi:uncharacterized tellurite resistance protein B-like protein